jgi:hypothetical protein
MQSTKYRWSNLIPFDKMPSTISLRPAKKFVIIIFFVPMACRVLGMTSVGGSGNVFEGG